MQRNGTILVVEDSAIDRELIEMAFRGVGVTSTIHFLENGAEAIAYLSGDRLYADRTRYAYPCLLMTDLKMPLADGFAVLDFLRQHGELAVIPTVVFSSSADPDDVRTAYRLGASSYIVKPRTVEELSRCLGTLIDYWALCEAPVACTSGKHVETRSAGKLGERFSNNPF